jgi:hypothetical protein
MTLLLGKRECGNQAPCAKPGAGEPTRGEMVRQVEQPQALPSAN